MSKPFIIKYLEEKPILNLKLLELPSNLYKDSNEAKSLDIFECIRKDDPFLEMYNPCLGLNIMTKSNPLESKPLDKSKFSISEDVTFVVRRKYRYEQYCEELVMTFEDSKTANAHLIDMRKLMGNDDPFSKTSIRFYDFGYKGFFKLGRDQPLPEKRMLTSLGYLIVMVEKHYEKDQGFEMIEDEEILDTFVMLSPIKVQLQKDQGTTEVFDYWSEFVDLERIPLKDHLRNPIEEMKMSCWDQVDVPLPSLIKDRKVLNQLLEVGFLGRYRKDLYKLISELQDDSKPIVYKDEFRKFFGTYYKKIDLEYNDVTPVIFPEFGGSFHAHDHYLNQKGINALKRLLCVLGHTHFDLEFCPSLVNLVVLFLYFMSEEEVFVVIVSLLKKSQKGKFLRTTKLKDKIVKETVKQIVASKYPQLIKHFENCNFGLDGLLLIWLDKFFHMSLPLDVILHILDLYIKKGVKGLIMIVLGILKHLEQDLLNCQNSSEIYSLCFTKPVNFNSHDEWECFKNAFALNLSQKTLFEMMEKNMEIFKYEEQSHQILRFGRPKIHDPSLIIHKESHWEILYSWLPYKQKNMTAFKVFSTSQDGYNLQTLINTIENIDGSFIILFLAVSEKIESKDEIKMIRSEKSDKIDSTHVHSIFGVFCAEPFSLKGKGEGSLNTFLFSLDPNEGCYRWTKNNDVIVTYSNSLEQGKSRQSFRQHVSFGVGGDGPGLYFDEDLMYGSSYRCATFDNEPLAGPSPYFTILRMEIYKFNHK